MNGEVSEITGDDTSRLKLSIDPIQNDDDEEPEAIDLDADLVDDLILGAPFADGFNDLRSDSGELLVVRGGVSLSGNIDLDETPPSTRVFGALELDQLGSDLATGDANDDQAPDFLADLPFVGWIFEMFFDQGPIAMSVIVIVIFLQIMLFRSRWGLRTRSVGEHPKAADTVGIDVIRLRYRNVILAGALAGLAGGYLTLEATGTFQNGMTAGRGFIALAALIFGRWTPVGALAGALLFAASERLGIAIGLRPPSGELGDFLGMLPNQFWAALPYLITIIILAGSLLGFTRRVG